MSKRLIPTGGGKSSVQFREAYGISQRGWKRLKAADDLPRMTWITSGKPIIRPQHEEQWLNDRTDRRHRHRHSRLANKNGWRIEPSAPLEVVPIQPANLRHHTKPQHHATGRGLPDKELPTTARTTPQTPRRRRHQQ